jgi:hypothetical protein
MNITVQVAPPIEDFDLETADRVIKQFNARRPRQEPLPSETNAEKKASLETILTSFVIERWKRETDQTAQRQIAKEGIAQKFQAADAAKRQAVLDILNG